MSSSLRRHLPRKPTRRGMLAGVGAMAAVVVASNILVQFLLLDGLLTWGALTYPLAFLITDTMNRVYGVAAARRVVLVGFVSGLLCSLVGSQIFLATGPAVSLRVAVGSGVAFLLAQLADVAVFDRLRDGRWWRAPLVSTLVGSALDTALFFTIAFSAQLTFFGSAADAAIDWAWAEAPFMGVGAMAPLWITLACVDGMIKAVFAVLLLMPLRAIVQALTPVQRGGAPYHGGAQ